MSMVSELRESLVQGRATGASGPRSRDYVWVWQFVRPQGAMLAVLMAFSLLATALALAQPWLTKLLIDEGLLARDYDRLLSVVGFMVLVGVSASALSGLNRYLHTRLSARILFALREHLYAHLQKLSPGFFGSRRLGDIVSRLDGDLAQIQRFAVDSLFSATTNTLSMVGALALMVSLEPMLTLMVLAVVPLEVLYLRRMRGKVEQGAREVRERSTDVGAFVIETLPATKFIQAVGAEQRELTRLRALGERHLSALLRFQLTEYATSAVPGLMTALARSAAFVVGGYQVIQGEWQIGALIAFSAYLAMVAGPVHSLLGLYVAAQRIAVNFERVLEIRRVNPAVSSPAEPVPLPATVRGEIVFDAVVFAHPERRERVLDSACACFPAGSKIALVGPSGAGKSTLVDLMMRYHDPLGGRILLDGIPLPLFALSDLRRCIAVVSQEIVLFRGSLRDNLRYANPAASDADIVRAVEDAQLSAFISSLPQGLDTELGERATQVSGGQKQRIAIARALLQNPSILLLDEATSAVDENTEARVVAAIDRLFGDRTRIIVSHRPGSLANADAVFVLHNGQLSPQIDQASEHG